MKKKQQESSCRSGCTSVRRRKDANDFARATAAAGVKFMPTHCAPGLKKNDVGTMRMRGGGSSQVSFLNGNADYTWYNTRFTMHRLEGGGGAGEIYPAVGCCGKAAQKQGNTLFRNTENFIEPNTINPGYLAANKCKLKNIEQDPNKTICSCPEKDYLDSVLKKKGQGVCMKKPCLGTDCLIKAFKDAQEFVDSIGKVPGLAGLGIVDSPYFGQPQDVRETRDTKKSESKPIPSGKPTETAVNIQNYDNIKKTSYAPSPERPAVQEGLISFPDPSTHASLKSKKKEEKTEKSKETENSTAQVANFEETPCGEPKCKSRPKKKKSVEMRDHDNGENVSSSREKTHKSDKKHSSKSKSGNSKSPRSSKKENQFIYNFGDSYPTSVYGHRNCSLARPRVPAKMGWMWNKTDPIAKLTPPHGWRPGAISVHILDILREAKAGFFKEAKRPRSAPLKSKKGKPQKTMSYTAMKKTAARSDDESEEEVEFPPTLHIHRKDGVYYVTMYPIRPETSDVPRLDEPINPLQFKIVKSKTSIASSSTASDMEIEFSPPAAVNRLKKKPNVVHVETQVKQQEILDAFRRRSSDNQKKKDSKTRKSKDAVKK